MPLIRTPDDRFQNLPDYPFAPHYLNVTVNGQTARMHYVDEGQGDEIVLCLHGEPSWSFLYRHIIRVVSPQHRVLAPDLIGFGKSDKFTEISDYSIQMHYDALTQWVEALDLWNITLVCQDWGGMLGLPLATELHERFARLVIMNTGLPTGDEPLTDGFLAWKHFAVSVGRDMRVDKLFQLSTVPQNKLTDAVANAYEAPFPTSEYKAGVASFPPLVPAEPQQAGADIIRAGRERLKNWEKPALVMFSDSDPVTRGGDKWFRALIPTAKEQPEIVITGAGHFLQEEAGETIGAEILAFLDRS
jgi:haloalkane dehalogenase